jgi:Flp pilus assembly protein TadG
MRRLLGDRTGGTAVEFAVVASGVVLLLLGSLEVGLLLWTNTALQVAAAQTARCAALDTCSPNPQSYAVSLAGQWAGAGAVKTSDVTVSSASICQGAAAGYSKFTMVTISSEVWNGLLMAPLSSVKLKASACYPSPT